MSQRSLNGGRAGGVSYGFMTSHPVASPAAAKGWLRFVQKPTVRGQANLPQLVRSMEKPRHETATEKGLWCLHINAVQHWMRQEDPKEPTQGWQQNKINKNWNRMCSCCPARDRAGNQGPHKCQRNSSAQNCKRNPQSQAQCAGQNPT